MQALVEHRPGPRQFAAAHQCDDKCVLDDLALRVAAADPHDIVEHGLQMADATGIVRIGKGVHRPAYFGHDWSGGELALGQALLDHAEALLQRR